MRILILAVGLLASLSFVTFASTAEAKCTNCGGGSSYNSGRSYYDRNDAWDRPFYRERPRMERHRPERSDRHRYWREERREYRGYRHWR